MVNGDGVGGEESEEILCVMSHYDIYPEVSHFEGNHSHGPG